MSFKAIGIKYFALFMALVAIVAGVYLTFFHSRGFVPATAKIVHVEPGTSSDDSTMYIATVEYTVDGKTYTSTLDSESSSYKTGQTMRVLYDPSQPSVVHDSESKGIIVILIGIAIAAVVIGTEIRSRKALSKVKQVQSASGQTSYPSSETGPERTLHFLTDTGTAKYGHRIEDDGGQILYEAKMTKFTLTAPYGFDFIDHEHGTTTPHLIGHEEETDWDTFLLDNHYTFTLDGEDIWKHLKRNGISVQSSVNAHLRTQYQILRDGVEIALAVTDSAPAAEGSSPIAAVAKFVPVRGFYRITTAQADLSLLFVVMLAFARSGATDAHGGNYGTIMGTINNIRNHR